MGTFLKIIVFIAILYLGVVAAVPWVKYKMFEIAFDNAIKTSYTADVPAAIQRAADGSGVNIKAEDIIIEEYEGEIKYSVTYEAQANLHFKILTFTYTLEGYKDSEEN